MISDLTNILNHINNIANKNIIEDIIDLPIFYINMDKSKDRDIYMKKQLKKSKRITALDGNYLENEKMKYILIDFENIVKYTNSELACTLSHLKTIRKARKNNFTLILEDDMYLKMAYLWNEKLSKYLNTLPKNWDIIQLSSNIDYFNDKKYIEWDGGASMGSYIVNKKFSNFVNDKLFYNKHFIKLINDKNYKEIRSDYFIYKFAQNNGFNVYSVPQKFIHNNIDLESTIHIEDTKDHIKNSLRVLREYNLDI